MKRSSLLELLHPDGSASTCLVIGSNCPTILLPESQTDACKEAALIILAPSADECRKNGWLVEAVQSLASNLTPDGVGYLLAPLRWRFKIIRFLHNSGLLINQPIGHLPDWTSSHYLVPFARNPARYAFSRLVPLPAWKRRLAEQWFRFPGTGRFLGFVWPSSGLVVRRPGARPLFEWLFKASGANSHPGSALLRTSWRGQDGTTVLYCFSELDAQPSAVAKITLVNYAGDHKRGEVALARLGPSAQNAGAQVPQPLRLEQKGNRLSLLQTVVHGQPAAELLRSQPDQLLSVITQVVDWLGRWHRSTAVVRPIDAEQLNQSLLIPAALLAPFIEGGEEYQNWLARRCKKAIGAPMSLVATHNDLTMANILIDEHGRLGVVDWETGQMEGWPLADFFYTLTDAVMIAGKYPDWLDAFKACFAPGGLYTSMGARLQTHLLSMIEISPDMAELCFHACWLHHAVNEHNQSLPATPRPFLKIVQWLALNFIFYRGKA